MSKKPVVDIRKEKKTGDLFLVHYAVHPVTKASVGWGKHDQFSESAFRVSGLAAVMKSLHEYSSRRNADEQTSVFRLPDPKDQLRRAKNHLCLGVRLERPSILILSPMRRERGGYVGKMEDEIALTLPCTPEQFYKQIESAFEECS